METNKLKAEVKAKIKAKIKEVVKLEEENAKRVAEDDQDIDEEYLATLLTQIE